MTDFTDEQLIGHCQHGDVTFVQNDASGAWCDPKDLSFGIYRTDVALAKARCGLNDSYPGGNTTEPSEDNNPARTVGNQLPTACQRRGISRAIGCYLEGNRSITSERIFSGVMVL